MNFKSAFFALLFGTSIICGAQQSKFANEIGKTLPTFLDLGSKLCVPCKLMSPIIDSLDKEFNSVLNVKFVEVGMGGDKTLAEKYKITAIPTQIFLAPDGKELWRHEGYISRYGILDKWRELGYAFAEKSLATSFNRFESLATAGTSKEAICSMCDGKIDPKTAVSVNTNKGAVKLCSPHCFFIMFSCLLEDTTGFDKKVSVTDFIEGKEVSAVSALFLYGKDEKTGRPWIKAFATKTSAEKAKSEFGGNILSWNLLRNAELSHRCGFCDRAVYPEDAAQVRADGLYTLGCCSHCALGVAVRTGKDIEVIQPDRLTGKPVIVKTFNGYIQSIDPPQAVAWFGQKKGSDGKFGSAGCFHQGFFTSEENLRNWSSAHPQELGKMISIDEALNDKMKLTEAQIHKACKIGECAPK
jgi:thioredoxin 1